VGLEVCLARGGRSKAGRWLAAGMKVSEADALLSRLVERLVWRGHAGC
jgi:hypothetical protein